MVKNDGGAGEAVEEFRRGKLMTQEEVPASGKIFMRVNK